ncbi:hypothetical protein HYPSUDRAFT_205790 [Hypholoma sublateritium FD-334 SS-4]|uniref:Alcohol dehydrogenase-like C-terminal domain-containing protein n=1 Tax=Hypholoma sublateritium (strain FD-334 SS-4) TaxID=945553 RepID=A0A0D2KTI3_HYPSF|nr:hypothetical protein HYPSUDRAFT_205790 [Hypholoma sublateritium FD-334 SS-4]
MSDSAGEIIAVGEDVKDWKSDGNKDLIIPLIKGATTLRGILIGSVDQFKDMVSLIEAHPELTKPVVDKVFPFEQAIDAYAYLESQKHVGKIVIKVSA